MVGRDWRSSCVAVVHVAPRLRDRAAVPLAARRPARRRDRDAPALPRLARHPRQPRDPRPAARRGAVRAHAARRLAAHARLARRARRASAGSRSSRTRGCSRCRSCSRRYLLWRRVGWAAALAVPVLAAVVMAPWVIRNKVERRLLRDHDRRPRALEGEQPQHLRRARAGQLDRPGARHPAAAGEPVPGRLDDRRRGRRRLRAERRVDRRPGVRAAERTTTTSCSSSGSTIRARR